MTLAQEIRGKEGIARELYTFEPPAVSINVVTPHKGWSVKDNPKTKEKILEIKDWGEVIIPEGFSVRDVAVGKDEVNVVLEDRFGTYTYVCGKGGLSLEIVAMVDFNPKKKHDFPLTLETRIKNVEWLTAAGKSNGKPSVKPGNIKIDLNKHLEGAEDIHIEINGKWKPPLPQPTPKIEL